MTQTLQYIFKKFKILIILFIAILITLGFSTDLLAQIWWFQSVNFLAVFYKTLTWKIGVAAVTFLFSFVFLYGNFWIADFLTKNRRMEFQLPAFVKATRRILALLALALALLIAFAVSSAAAQNWQLMAEFFHSTQANLQDPVFHKDTGFYFFIFPFYKAVRAFLFTQTLFALAFSVAVYFLKGAIQWVGGWRNLFGGAVKAHITVLIFFIFFLVAWNFWLQRYELLFSSQGIVFGPGYTDVHARIFAYNAMTVITLLSAVLLFVSLFRKDITLLAAGIGVLLAALFLIVGIYPWGLQKFVVEPNELEKEKPYISHNIEFTRKAYGLDTVERSHFSIEPNASLHGISAITNNIRLWDWQPLLDTYRQIQEMRLYYRFHDVDPDRYFLNGQYRQVMTAARELDYTRIPQQARTWVNEHIKYTHGYGLVMSPVDEVTEQGMPRLFIKDIPPVALPEYAQDLKIERPEIYYGELTSEYIFTGTTTDEFDYPMGDKNKSNRYQGKGGVPLDSFFKRAVYALHFKTLKLLLSEYITSESKIHYQREILPRIKDIAPFLYYDNDPYLSIVNGRLLWIVDAYTVANRFPYAEPHGRGMNYIRNSVKVVIDAYDGDITFYLVDDADILAQTYAKIYPQLFSKAEKIPTEIKNHFRYPEELFRVQSNMYLSYHMSDASVFYNREDMWRTPHEMYQGTERNLEPYYLIMPLPKQKKHEYLLIQPFTPVKKNNMIAWMTARSDAENYGKLVLYEFPKKELVYGPMQIEARIDQDPKISELLTLWSQKGSQVIRGNLIVIPYQGNILYVEPLYLRAEQAQMPELKRVIVAYKNKIVMSESLEQSLQQVMGNSREFANAVLANNQSADINGTDNRPSFNNDTNLKNLIQRAMDLFAQSQQALAVPDWPTYGKKQKELQEVLQNLKNFSK